MQGTLIDQVRELLRPYGLFLLGDGPQEPIATKRGGRIYLTETPDGFRTEIVRRDGTTVTDVRPVEEPGKHALAVRVMAAKAHA